MAARGAKMAQLGSPKPSSQASLSDNEDPSESTLMEDEIMLGAGNRDFSSDRSKRKEQNLHQMIQVLHSRLASLETAAQARRKACEDDLAANSERQSIHVAKVDDETELTKTMVPSSPLDDSSQQTLPVTNLLSLDGVMMDQRTLVFRSKPVTEASKRLEQQIDELVAGVNAAKAESLNSRNVKSTIKKPERTNIKKKFEKKKQERLRYEKILSSSMEGFVTRSALDKDMNLSMSAVDGQHVSWPISVRRNRFSTTAASTPTNEQETSVVRGDVEGEMDPELLLNYSLERINLPSGKMIFKWLSKQESIQSITVYMFWFIKCKMFQENSTEAQEYLLGQLSQQYVRVMEILARKTREQHEKDFIFYYLPFIIGNAVYFGYYYLLPGSRHLYGKDFRRLVYMHMINVLSGVQICSVSLKVQLASLFPEDMADDEEFTDEDKLMALPDPSDLAHGMTLATSSAASRLGHGSKATQQKEFNSHTLIPHVGNLASPLERTHVQLKPQRPGHLMALWPRQQKARMNCTQTSPLMQQHLRWATPSGLKRQEGLGRTIPVSWAVAGSSETHRKKIVDTELHAVLLKQLHDLNYEARHQQVVAIRERTKKMIEIEDARATVLRGGTDAVGRYTVDLIKKQKSRSGVLETTV